MADFLCYNICMFTGLIEEVGIITQFNKTSDGAVIKVNATFEGDVKLGDSISVNGVCLTVIDINSNILSFEVSKETLSVTNFSNLKAGNRVNLERAMRADARFDGHIVSGHIDGTAKIKDIIKDGFSYEYEFYAEKDILKYIVKKGSVSINGISLTVSKVKDNSFSVEIIPHTLDKTNLKYLEIGNNVNIETDILSKYIEKFLYLANNNKEKSTITINMLEENGYL